MSSGQSIGDREREILTAIVETFISTGEPVGSRMLSRSSREGLSSATIRNVMADLADAGFLEQPHTSAGRVPSASAYRYYVEQLSGKTQLSQADEGMIQDSLQGVTDVQEFMERTSHVLSLISRNVGVAVAASGPKNALEHVYFSRPDSIVFGRSVEVSREALGRELAREAPVEADIVVPVPDSGVSAAMGYASESGIPFRFGLIRNHYIGRTFIEPQQQVRDFGVKLKLNAVRGILEGKRVVLIDDSIVRGTTSQKIVRMVRNAGAREVHMRISCPPTISPCFYGVDTPSKKHLIAANKSVEEIREYIGADSLSYLSLEGMKKGCGEGDKATYCTACYTGKYPTDWVDVEEIQPATVKS